MSKCRENRNRHKRNRRRNQQTRIVAWLRDNLPLDGNARPYYEPTNIVVTRRKKRRVNVKYRIRQTQAYRDLIGELIAKCGDMTVDLSALKPAGAEA